jgi:hypothetical protein
MTGSRRTKRRDGAHYWWKDKEGNNLRNYVAENNGAEKKELGNFFAALQCDDLEQLAYDVNIRRDSDEENISLLINNMMIDEQNINDNFVGEHPEVFLF